MRGKERVPARRKYREAFVVEDGDLITARYPRDVHLFAQKLVDRLKMNVN
jgi:putative intracellular protease/amidase